MNLSELQSKVNDEFKRRKIRRTEIATYNIALQILKGK